MHPISETLSEVYRSLHERGETSFPLADAQIVKIDSVVKTVNSSYWGFNRYPSSEDRASAYFYFIIKDHPVIDGNKRLATIWLQIYCSVTGLAINQTAEVDVLAVAVEESQFEPDTIIALIKEILFGRIKI